jgi:NADPH-dependent ferric siderophore reductase
MPEMGPDGPRWPEGAARSPARDYTPRSFDPATGTLTIDLFVHGDGPGSGWADAAAPGDVLGVAGPRGSAVLEAAFDWYLLVGDESALPTIARRLEDLPAGAPAVVVVSAADERDRGYPGLEAPGRTVRWATAQGGDPEPLLAALRDVDRPQGRGFAWAAGEATVLRDVRRWLLDEAGFDRDRVDVNGHWRRGTTDFDHHAEIEE